MMRKATAFAYSMPMGIANDSGTNGTSRPKLGRIGIIWFIIPMRKPPAIAP